MNWLTNLRNRIDFAVRQKLTFGRKVDERSLLSSDLEWQKDARVFLRKLDWKNLLAPLPKKIRMVDVGARTFALAPVLEGICIEHNREPEIVGIELDAYRRFVDMRTRGDHGRYWADSIAKGRFLAMDILDFHERLEVVCLLDPFVSEDPLLAWGLPLASFAPAKIFAHCAELLTPDGAIVISNPSDDECAISDTLLRQLGFEETDRAHWSRGDHRRVLRVFKRS